MDRQIDFVDFWKYLLSKWKVLVFIVIAFMIIFTLFGYFVGTTNVSNRISEEDKEKASDSLKIVESYQSLYDEKNEYIDNSIYQNLDPYAIKTLVLTYYVNNFYEVSYPVMAENNDLSAIIQTYVSLFSQNDLYEKMSHEIDDSIAPSYYKEIIEIDYNQSDKGLFSLKIYASSDEMLNKMGDFIKTAVSQKTNEISNIYGLHELILVSEVADITIDNDVANNQRDNIKAITEIRKAISDEYNTLSDEQKEYIDNLTQSSKENNESLIKFMIIGALVGLFVYGVVFVLKYIFSGTIKTADELECLFGLCVVGLNSEILSLKLELLAKQHGFKNILIMFDDTNSMNNVVLSNSSVCFDGKIFCQVVADAESMEAFYSADAVILAVSLKKTKYSSIEEELNYCNIYSKEILGAIVI